jgi:hypothetical protein
MRLKFTRSEFPRIDITTDAAERIRFAADELRRYLGLVLGVEPGVPEQPQSPVVRLLKASRADLGAGKAEGAGWGDGAVDGGGLRQWQT